MVMSLMLLWLRRGGDEIAQAIFWYTDFVTIQLGVSRGHEGDGQTESYARFDSEPLLISNVRNTITIKDPE